MDMRKQAIIDINVNKGLYDISSDKPVWAKQYTLFSSKQVIFQGILDVESEAFTNLAEAEQTKLLQTVIDRQFQRKIFLPLDDDTLRETLYEGALRSYAGREDEIYKSSLNGLSYWIQGGRPVITNNIAAKNRMIRKAMENYITRYKDITRGWTYRFGTVLDVTRKQVVESKTSIYQRAHRGQIHMVHDKIATPGVIGNSQDAFNKMLISQQREDVRKQPIQVTENLNNTDLFLEQLQKHEVKYAQYLALQNQNISDGIYYTKEQVFNLPVEQMQEKLDYINGVSEQIFTSLIPKVHNNQDFQADLQSLQTVCEMLQLREGAYGGLVLGSQTFITKFLYGYDQNSQTDQPLSGIVNQYQTQRDKGLYEVYKKPLFLEGQTEPQPQQTQDEPMTDQPIVLKLEAGVANIEANIIQSVMSVYGVGQTKAVQMIQEGKVKAVDFPDMRIVVDTEKYSYENTQMILGIYLHAQETGLDINTAAYEFMHSLGESIVTKLVSQKENYTSVGVYRPNIELAPVVNAEFIEDGYNFIESYERMVDLDEYKDVRAYVDKIEFKDRMELYTDSPFFQEAPITYTVRREFDESGMVQKPATWEVLREKETRDRETRRIPQTQDFTTRGLERTVGSMPQNVRRQFYGSFEDQSEEFKELLEDIIDPRPSHIISQEERSLMRVPIEYRYIFRSLPRNIPIDDPNIIRLNGGLIALFGPHVDDLIYYDDDRLIVEEELSKKEERGKCAIDEKGKLKCKRKKKANRKVK